MITKNEYRSKVLGCWMGKNIGGTLGAPFEWKRQVNNVSFYTQELGGNPLPNDDLDIQLLWLIMMEEQGINVNSALLAEYWQHFVAPYWAEYGTAKVNMQAGLMPPFSGIRNNDFKDSCGAFIRSEIWACIAPGNPQLAVKYAYEDASIDHGDGEGMYAEIFVAAIQSAAFVEKDPVKLIDIGLSYIPAECGIAQAVRCAQDMYNQGKTWLEARNEMLKQYRGSVFFCHPWHICQEDVERGFDTGKFGWDAPSNIGILVIGLLYGEGDFEKSLCVAVNCGEDTDCTGATIGALFGIIHGIESIPEKWITPIGRSIKTACLNLGDLGYFGDMIPKDVDNLTDRTEVIMRQVAAQHNLPIKELCLQPKNLPELYSDEKTYKNICTPAHRHVHPFYDVAVEYVTGVSVAPGDTAKIKITITNKFRIQASMNLRWYGPCEWKISPTRECKTHVGQSHWPVYDNVLDFELTPPENAAATTRFAVEITVDGRATVILVPVMLFVEM